MAEMLAQETARDRAEGIEIDGVVKANVIMKYRKIPGYAVKLPLRRCHFHDLRQLGQRNIWAAVVWEGIGEKFLSAGQVFLVFRDSQFQYFSFIHFNR